MLIRWLHTTDPVWDELVAKSVCKDFYYLGGYTQFDAKRLAAEASLLVVEDQGDFVGFPILLRPISPGRSNAVDATCVYGYAGPIFSRSDFDSGLLTRFKSALTHELRSREVVALFARLHPLFDQSPVCDGLGEVRTIGETAAIDLCISEQDQKMQLRSGIRYNLRQAKRHELDVVEDPDWRHLKAFLEIYQETMVRVGAANEYWFPPEYYTGLRAALGDKIKLILCFFGATPVAGAIFVESFGIVQWHLGGTRTHGLRMSPMSLLLWKAVELFRGRNQILHLGGGVRARPDSVFMFKSGFSKRRYPFRVWRWIIDEAAYRRACIERLIDLTESDDYFPRYRRPLTGLILWFQFLIAFTLQTA